MTAAERAVRCLVSGRVQGVFYRASTAEQARGLGVRGWARNLPDGRVEVVAAGSDAQVAQLIEWLWEGSAAARVESVEVSEWSEPVDEGFAAQ